MNIKIDTEYIKLDQLLKFSGVEVDDELCQMRGKKMYPGSKAVVYLDEDNIVELKVE